MSNHKKTATITNAVREARTLPDRKHPIHLTNVDRYNEPIILFVTVCTKDRKAALASDDVHRVMCAAWKKSLQYRVGRYILMPDHIHLFCSPAVRNPENVSKWVAYWKRTASSELKDLQPLWQRNCWDTQLRSSQAYTEKWEYVAVNPVRKGLVKHPDDWPWQGCLNELRW